MNKTRILFEEWFIAQYGEDKKNLLEDFDEEKGYKLDSINAVWVGFNAEIEICIALHNEVKVNGGGTE